MKPLIPLFYKSKKKLWITFIIIILGFILGVTLISKYNEKYIVEELKAQITSAYNNKLRDTLKLELIHLSWSSSLTDLMNGSIKNLKIILDSDIYTIEVLSQLEIDLKTISINELLESKKLPKLSFSASPEIKILSKKDGVKLEFSSNIQAHLPDSLQLKGELLPLDLPQYFLKSSKINVDFSFQNSKALLGIYIHELSVNHEEKNLMVQINKISAQSSADIDLNQNLPVSSIQIDLSASDSEALFGDDYYALTKEILKTQIDIDLKNEGVDIQSFLKSKLFLSVTAQSIDKKQLDIKWSLQNQKISNISNYYSQITRDESEPIEILKTLKSGTLESHGSLRLLKTGELLYFKGEFKIKNATLHSKKSSLFFKNLNFTLPLNSNKTTKSKLSFEKLYFKKLEIPQMNQEFLVEYIKNGSSFKVTATQPLHISSSFFELNIPKFSMQIPQTRLELPLTFRVQDIASLSEPLCLNETWLPPAQLNIEYENILFTKNNITTKGRSRLELFDGFIDLKNLKIFDATTAAPETQFDLIWDQIQLESLGKFLSFGKMNGFFMGHAKEVTMQGLLPTQFQFLLKAQPLPKKEQIVFSSKAMKNLVLILTGDSLEQSLPGFAQWLAFGLPSQALGGYDVNYFGISLLSKKSIIALETLDPETRLDKEGKHYILYGPRFKIPIKAYSYPVFLDAPAMGHFVRHMATQFENLKKSEESVEMREQQEKLDEIQEAQCIPPLNF